MPRIAAGHPRRTGPFVGARPFGSRDRHLFLGRTETVRDLVGAWTGARLTVLHGDAGVGKTSLLHAGAVPALTDRGAHVLPVGRLLIDPAFPSAVLPEQNPFTRALLASWNPDEFPTHGPGRSAGDFLRDHARADRYGRVRPLYAALDQTEPLLRSPALPEPHRGDLIDELLVALDDHPGLHLLLTVRTEHLADLRRVIAAHGADHAEVRLGPLTPTAAVEATAHALDTVGVQHARAVAERLVEEVRTLPGQPRTGPAVTGGATEPTSADRHGRPGGLTESTSVDGHGRPGGLTESTSVDGHGRPGGLTESTSADGHGRPGGLTVPTSADGHGRPGGPSTTGPAQPSDPESLGGSIGSLDLTVTVNPRDLAATVDPALLQTVGALLYAEGSEAFAAADVDRTLAVHLSLLLEEVAAEHLVPRDLPHAWLRRAAAAGAPAPGTDDTRHTDLTWGLVHTLQDRHLVTPTAEGTAYRLRHPRLARPLLDLAAHPREPTPQPWTTADRIVVARRAHTRGEPDLAGEHARQALRSTPPPPPRDRATLTSLLGDLAFERGEPAVAAAYYAEAAELLEAVGDSAGVARLLVAQSSSRLRAGQRSAALDGLRAAAGRVRGDSSLRTGIGQALWRIGQSQSALDVLDAVLTGDRSASEARRTRNRIRAELMSARGLAPRRGW
ncbi:ATP-binding protein [Nocardiopsis sp. NPDC049922]|uniref:nSTAND1 domain-containing NTPase n=1 Tax=Nocardiopsis sp. NPDC049922 TaxID=3155157 RepID=UPI0033F3D825